MFQATIKFFKPYIDKNNNIEYYNGSIVDINKAKDLKAFVPHYANIISIDRIIKPTIPIKVVLYVSDINIVGGIETFIFNFSKKYKELDINIIYRSANIDQLIYLSKYANLKVDDGKEIICDYILISNYDAANILERTKKKKAYQVFHAVISDMAKKSNVNYKKHLLVDELVSVSQAAHDGLLEYTGLESKIIYNVLDEDIKSDAPLKLITISRMAKIKGFSRLVQMAREFKEKGIPFIWFVTGDDSLRQNPTYAKWLDSLPEIVIIPYNVYNKYLIGSFDYLVQLSDTESFCYSAYEALQNGVPVIITNYDEAKRTVQDGINGYILEMDLSNLDVEKIYNNIPKKVSYTDNFNENDWLNLLK